MVDHARVGHVDHVLIVCDVGRVEIHGIHHGLPAIGSKLLRLVHVVYVVHGASA